MTDQTLSALTEARKLTPAELDELLGIRREPDPQPRGGMIAWCALSCAATLAFIAWVLW